MDTDYAWAAGFLDGEGCFYVWKRDGGARQNAVLRVVQVSREPLDRLQSILGGRVSGPRCPPSHKGKPYYSYTLNERDLHQQIKLLWPYLCGPKRSQYRSVIDRIETRVI